MSKRRVRQAALSDANDQLTGQLAGARATIDREQAARADLQASNERLIRQLAATRDDLKRLAQALANSEATELKQETVIGDLEGRLTEALVNRVEELERYRSEFFGKLREVLGDRRDVRVVGDRFVFQSEVLFASGSAELEPAGQEQLGQLAETLISISTTFHPKHPFLLAIIHTSSLRYGGLNGFGSRGILSHVLGDILDHVEFSPAAGDLLCRNSLDVVEVELSIRIVAPAQRRLHTSARARRGFDQPQRQFQGKNRNPFRPNLNPCPHAIPTRTVSGLHAPIVPLPQYARLSPSRI